MAVAFKIPFTKTNVVILYCLSVYPYICHFVVWLGTYASVNTCWWDMGQHQFMWEIVKTVGHFWTAYINVSLHCLSEVFHCHFLIVKSGYALAVPLLSYVLGSKYFRFRWHVSALQVEGPWYLNAWHLWWGQWCECKWIRVCTTTRFLDIRHFLLKQWTLCFREWICSYTQVKKLGVICLVGSDRKRHPESLLQCRPNQEMPPGM